MTKLLQQFNARNFDPSQGIGGFPIGNHVVKAIKSDVKATKAGDGGFLMYDAVIVDGEHAGTHGAIRFNLYSSSPDAARIAHQQFSAMCHVCGVMDVQDSSQLHEIPFRVEVGLQKEPNPNKYTEVKRFFDAAGNEPVAGQPGNTGAQASSGFGQAQGQQQQANGFAGQQQGQQPPQQGQQQGGWGQQAQGQGTPQEQQPQGAQQQQWGQQGGAQQQGQTNGAWGQQQGQGSGNGQSWGQGASQTNGQQQWGQQR